MKSVLFILGIIVAVNANPTPTTSLDEDGLKKIAQDLFKEVEYLLLQTTYIERYSQDIVQKKLLQSHDMKPVHAAINKTIEAQTVKLECAKSVDEHLRQAVVSISEELLKNAVKDITGDDKSLDENKLALKDILTTLTSSLDEEVASCLSNEEKCKLTGELKNQTKELSKLIEEPKYDIVDFVKTSKYYESESFHDKIKKEVVEPSLECLK